MFKYYLKIEQCESCGLIEWRGNKLSFQLHHKNGIHNDNRLENLQILCPNCHTQTDSYAGKNKKESAGNKKNICSCGGLKSINSVTCRKCSNTKKQEFYNSLHPNIKILKEEILLLGYTKVGRKYKVSATTVRRWIKKSI